MKAKAHVSDVQRRWLEFFNEFALRETSSVLDANNVILLEHLAHTQNPDLQPGGKPGRINLQEALPHVPIGDWKGLLERWRSIRELASAEFLAAERQRELAANRERATTIHNERVKLNATFSNSLAVWFAGAGSAGALINTLLSAQHNFDGAAEIGVSGVVLAIVLKWLANRELGKLR